jgi:hypothetical protein
MRKTKIPQSELQDIQLLINEGLSDSQVASRLTERGTPASDANVFQFRKRNQITPSRVPGGQPGSQNAAWVGGKTIDKDGYVLLYMPDHPHANHAGYIREHRFVMEQVLGRLLNRTEVVHHLNGLKSDNRPENLELFEENAEHLRHTLKGRCPNWTDDGKRRILEGIARGAANIKGKPMPEHQRLALVKSHIARKQQKEQQLGCLQPIPEVVSSPAALRTYDLLQLGLFDPIQVQPHT